ncbi:MAG: tetrahydromethanopterin S-methyltransferase subunit A, partial [Microgenomates group bacterium LiPW_16]
MKVKVSHWPVEEGRYKIGNPQSPVAVCTEATVEGINVALGKVAIIGKCVTENIGIEKVVKNIVSNPNIRFLILCGKKSAGHDVGQTLISLKENGVDRQMRVIGSTGSIPVV